MIIKQINLDKIGIQKLLSQWDMEVFKDHAGKYYIFHDGGEDYFHGEIEEYDTVEAIPDCIMDSLLEEELADQAHFMQRGPVRDCEEAKTLLSRFIMENTDSVLLGEAKQRLQIIEGIMGNVYDDVPKEKTNLILAIYEAMQQGLLAIKFSDTITSLGCSGVFCRVDIGTFQDEFYFNRYCADAESLEEFYKMVEDGSSRGDHWYGGTFFESDYDEGGYEKLEIARDIAATLMDMTEDELEANEGCMILTCLQRSLPDYYADVIGKEIDKAMETLKQADNDRAYPGSD